MSDRAGDSVQHHRRLHLQLVLHVQGAGGDDDVDAPALGVLDRLGATVDVDLSGAAQARHRALGDDLGDLTDGLEIAIGGDWETGLDNVDAHVLQDLGELELLFQGHRGARRLLAVAHGGVEDDDAVALRLALSCGLVFGGHGELFLVCG